MMNKWPGTLIVAAALAAALSSCAPTARLVVVDPAGGAVAIFRNTPAYREKAEALMDKKCPGGYRIVREEEYVTGETVTRERNTGYDKIREEVRTTDQKRTRSDVEWRIIFTCR